MRLPKTSAIAALLTVALALPGVATAQGRAALGPAQESLLKAAREAAEARDHDKALEILRGLLQLGEIDVAYIEEARNHLALGRCDEAEASLAKASAAKATMALSAEELQAALAAIEEDMALNCQGKANAAQLYNLGLDYFAKREWDKAAQAFELALEIDPNPTLAHNAGRSHEYAGHLDKAEVLYQRALDLGPDDEIRDRVERNLERLSNLREQLGARANDGTGLLEVNSEPSGAIVRVDGVAVGQTPFQQAVAPGTFAVTLSLEGHAERSQQVELEAGREVVLSVTLEPDGRVWTWVGLGTTAALLAGGVTFGVLAQNDLDTINEAGGKRDPDFESIRDRGQAFSNISLGLYLSAAAAAVASGVFFAVESPEEPAAATAADPEARLRLILAPDFIGISGAF